MDHPLHPGDKLPTTFTALLLAQSVGVFEVRQRADMPMAVPVRQRFWKWGIQRLAVRPFGPVPEIADAGQCVTARRGRILHIEQDGWLLYVKAFWLQGPDKVDA